MLQSIINWLALNGLSGLANLYDAVVLSGTPLLHASFVSLFGTPVLVPFSEEFSCAQPPGSLICVC